MTRSTSIRAGRPRARSQPVLAGQCRVWWAAPSAVSSDDAVLLDNAERRRLEGFRQPGNRARFLCAAVLLRRLVAAETGVAPEDVAVDRTWTSCGDPHGRPRLAGLGLYASIAHSGDRVGVALTGVGPVGLDVEEVASRDVHRLAPRVLREGEEAAGLVEFYRYWTRKESVVKATGDGFTVGLRRVAVSPPHEPARLVDYPDASGLVAAMHDLQPGDGYLSAITVLGTTSCPVAEEWWPAGDRPSSVFVCG